MEPETLEQTETIEAPELFGTGTYSPEDNKLRLYPFARLSKELYARVKAAGFSWAPKQELFVAPMWTPDRSDLLEELCGEIDDEDKSLTERAEERAERFEDYSDKRGADAERARKAVSAIADNIPFGQPILVGHHSERHARRDAEKIENGMRRAVKMWETSTYWTRRAAGAIRTAKHKERPDVRARRIKTLDAALRKQQRNAEPPKLNLWDFVTFDEVGQPKRDAAGKIIVDGSKAVAAKEEQKKNWTAPDWALRWIAHYENRLAYERAMLAADGGTVADQTGPEKGGGVRCWCSPGHGRGWSYVQRVNKVSVSVFDNWDNGGANFPRVIPFDKLAGVMTAADVEEARSDGRLHEMKNGVGFYIDEKPETRAEANDRVHVEAVAAAEPESQAEDFKAMRESLRAGVKVVTAPQLFPTPAELAREVITTAEIRDGQRILEPSFGTGALLKAIEESGAKPAEVVGVEISRALAGIGTQIKASRVLNSDFLTLNGEDIGLFDRIVMNPPFVRGADIDHIKHALGFLKPGGRLVAICADGPRQNEQLRPMSSRWRQLPEGSFAEQGTGVRTALAVFDY